MTSNKILVIDDSRVIRARVIDMLPPGNFEVFEAKDGVEGLNLLRQENPNLIMLDFLLPRLSGWEVFQEIQKNSDWQKIPLVLMSGRKAEVVEKIQEPFEYFEFIPKPFEQKELLEAIKSAMAKARLPRQQVTVDSNIVTQPLPEAEPVSKIGELTGETTEIKMLNEKINKMQAEIDTVKKQMAQIVAFIQQKLK